MARRKSCGLRASVLPVRPRCRGAGAGQPIQRDVVEDVVPGEVAGGLARRRRRWRSCSRSPCRGRAATPPGRRVNPAGRSRPSAAAWPSPGSSRSPSVLKVSTAVERGAFLLGFRRQGVGSQDRHEQVHVDADQPLGCLAAHRVGDGGAHVAALGDVAVIAEAAHQLRPRHRDAAGGPAELGRLAREAVARQGREHQMERVLGASAVRGRVGERADDLEQLDDRAGPAVGHDQRHRVLVRRPHVDEVDVRPVDLGRELLERVELRLGLAPVVVGGPVARELLHRRQPDALRRDLGRAPCWASASPRCARRRSSSPLLRNLDVEGPDRRLRVR